MIDEVIAISSPFIFALLLQLLRPGVPAYARLLLNNNLAGTTTTITNEDTKTFIIELALLIYSHLGFVFGMLTASVSCVALTIRSQRGSLALVGAVALVSVLAYWVVYLQTLTASQLTGKEGRWMRVINWLVVLILWAITLYARFYPNPGNLPQVQQPL